MGKNKATRPVCSMHADCFALLDGRCVCLTDNDFGERDCTFYKPNTEIQMSQLMEECKAYAEAHK